MADLAPAAHFAPDLSGEVELFLDRYKDTVRYNPALDCWHVYVGGGYWQQDRTKTVLYLCKRLDHERFQSALKIEDPDERSRQVKWAVHGDAKRRDLILRDIEILPEMQRVEWDADPQLLCVNNGILDLSTGLLHEGVPTHYCTMRAPITYNPNASCPTFVKFLQDIFGPHPEVIPYIRRVLGYCLTGFTTAQCLFYFFGPTAMNGKTTLVDTMRGLMGEYAGSMNFESMRTDHGPNSEFSTLSTKRLISVSEPSASKRTKWDDAFVKRSTGEEMMTRALYKNSFSFEPRFKIIVDGNHPVRVDDITEGFWRRIHVVPFDERFDGDKTDPNLTKKLKLELPGILNFCVDGYKQYQQSGLLPIPEVVTLSTKAQKQALVQESHEIVEGFINAKCDIGPDFRAQAFDLFATFKEWCTKNAGRDEMLSRPEFSRALISLGYALKPTNKANFYIGLRIHTGISTEAPQL